MANTNRFSWHHGGKQAREAEQHHQQTLREIFAPLHERLSREDYVYWCREAINRPGITHEKYQTMVERSLELLNVGAGIVEILEELALLDGAS